MAASHEAAQRACAAAMFDAVVTTALGLEPELTVRRFDELPDHLQASVTKGLTSLVPVIIRVATPTKKDT